MSSIKSFENLQLTLILLVLFPTTVYGNWPGDFIIRGLKQGDQSHSEKFNPGVQLDLFADDDYAATELLFILERTGIKSNLPEEMFKRLRDARRNPSWLFHSPFRPLRKTNKSASLHHNLSISHLLKLTHYRSAIDVLRSDDVYRVFFFSLFDPSKVHIDDLFVGLRVHNLPAYQEIGFDEVREIATHIQTTGIWDEWLLFKDMAEQAISEGHLKAGIIDIEAGFLI